MFPLSSVELYLLKKALDHKTTDEEHLRLHLHQPLLSFWVAHMHTNVFRVRQMSQFGML